MSRKSDKEVFMQTTITTEKTNKYFFIYVCKYMSQ